MGITLDTRLIGKVQTKVGSKVHEAAGLINCYQLWVRIANSEGQTDDERKEALETAQKAEQELRRFAASL